LLERIENESLWQRSSAFADVFEGHEALQSLELASEVIGCDEVGEMLSKLLMALEMEALNGGFLDGSVHSLDLPVIRYVSRGALLVRLCWRRRPGRAERSRGGKQSNGTRHGKCATIFQGCPMAGFIRRNPLRRSGDDVTVNIYNFQKLGTEQLESNISVEPFSIHSKPSCHQKTRRLRLPMRCSTSASRSLPIPWTVAQA
jgi:hypothetical protein